MPGLFPTDFRLVDAAPERELVYRCAAVRRALWAWLDEELPLAAVKDLEAHLSICPACVIEARMRRELHRLLRRHAASVAARLPDAARGRILARVAASTSARARSSRPATGPKAPTAQPLRA
jgi:anti-sigma factor RsiW